jgi:hypothetical protein
MDLKDIPTKASPLTVQRWCREGMPTPEGKVSLNFKKVGRENVFEPEEVRRILAIRGA